jgi:HK97 family phage portal protein
MITQNRILWLPNGVEERNVAWDDVSPSSVRNPSGLRIDSETSLQSTVVLACARVLAESIASLPLHIYEYLPQGGKAPAREHPLYRRLHVAPNSWQTAFEWREQQVLWLCLWGNSYNLLVPGSAGFATELWPLHPSRMKPERVENGRIRYKYRDENGREETYTQDQIMHIRWLSDDGINGMIPVELARDAIGLARACEIHGARYFGNGARPGFVLTTDNDMKPEAAATLRDNWERMHRGADRASRTAVLFGGLKPMELAGSNNQESQFLETRRFQIEEVCRLYRVPPHLVGDLSRSSFSNIEQQSIDFVQYSLLPWLRRFENAFARDLIVEDEKYFAEFDTRGLLRGDAAARASYYSSLYNLGVASINEIRSWESLNPVEGGDLRFVQLNMQTLTQANAAANAPPEDAAASDGPPAEEQPTADVASIVAIVDQIGKGAITPEAAKAVFESVFPQMPDAIASSIIEGATKTPEEPAPAEPTQPESVPAGRSLWQGSLRDSEGRSLTISIDFDRTFAADPELMGDFAAKAKADGNSVVMITRRADTPEDRKIIEDTLGSYADAFDAVILAGPDTQKEAAAKRAGIGVDIWIDDSPQTIKEIRGFCPTGPGGGIDNSCGKEGGGGGKYAKGDPMKRGDIKTGQRISITKAGQKTTRTGVVVSVTHGEKESEITLRGDDGKESSVKIRDLAKITDQPDGGSLSPPPEKPAGSKVNGTRPDKAKFSVDAEGRKQFRSAVAAFCQENGVTLLGGFGELGIPESFANLVSLDEVAAGVETCRREGVPLPPAIKFFAPTTPSDENTFGYYMASSPNAIHINAQLDPGRLEVSQKSGWTVGAGAGWVVVHEAAHAAHDRALRSDPTVARGDQLGHVNRGIAGLPVEPLKGAAASMAASAVSRYATTEPAEFVAETYTAHVSGRRVPPRLWKLYRRYGGPQPPGGFPDKD